MTKKATEVQTVGPGNTPARKPFVVPGQDPATAPMPGQAPPLRQFPPMQQQQQPPGYAGPQQITGEVKASDFGELYAYLKGSDLPLDHNNVEVTVTGFVKIPGSRSPLVATIVPVFGREYLPLNKININQIKVITGQEDLRCIIGRKLVLTIYPVNNPSTGTMARGLYVTDAI
jgi:hypothetical protein